MYYYEVCMKPSHLDDKAAACVHHNHRPTVVAQKWCTMRVEVKGKIDEWRFASMVGNTNGCRYQ